MLTSLFDELYRVNREMNRMFGDNRTYYNQGWPGTNIYENETEYMVVMKTPGVSKEDISITLKDNSLKIAGEIKPDENEKKNYHLKERFTGKYERNFILNDKIDINAMGAEIKNGILLIKLPKSPETKPVKINIK